MEARFPAADSRGHTVFKTLVCVLAALPPQGELGGRKPSPLEPDPAVEPAEPNASRTELGEQGTVPRGAEAVHVRGPGGGRLSTRGSWLLWPRPAPLWAGTAPEPVLNSLSFSLFPWSVSGFLQVVVVGFHLLFKGTAHCQKLLSLLLELSALLKIQLCQQEKYLRERIHIGG